MSNTISGVHSNDSFPQKQINNNKITNVKGGMPFKPDIMTQGNDFNMGRQVYISNSIIDLNKNTIRNPPSNSVGLGLKKFNQSSGEYVSSRKMNAVGKSSINTQSPQMSFSSKDQNLVNSALSRVRGGGCVAPKKKGAV
jgi:hypothetical protein